MTPYSTRPAILAAILVVTQRVLPLFVLAGVFLAFLLFTSRAQADQEPTMTDAPGSIAGHVVNPQDQPIANLYAQLYSYPFASSSSPVRQIPVDASGNYTFSLLGPGIYRVGFSDPNQIYGRQFYSNSAQFSTAVDIPVIGQQITRIDARLRLGGTILGVIALKNYPGGDHTVQILLFERTPSGWNEMSSRVIENSSDSFSFGGLAAGTYRVCALSEPVNGSTFWRGCYDILMEMLDMVAPQNRVE